jgi:hypothetical protein
VRRFHDDWHEAHSLSGRVAYAMAAGVPGPEILIHRPHQPRDQLAQLSLARAGIPHRVLVTLGCTSDRRSRMSWRT